MKVTFGLSEFHKQNLTELVQSHTLLPKYQGPMADLAGAINAAWPVDDWPSPPGVAALDAAQKTALFAAECGIGPQSAFDALTPGMDESTRNVYRQYYGPSAVGWPEVQYWYAHR